MIGFVTWVETHKDFCIAIGALLSPFAAVLIGLVAAKWQATTLLNSTRMQIRANALRDYRQPIATFFLSVAVGFPCSRWPAPIMFASLTHHSVYTGSGGEKQHEDYIRALLPYQPLKERPW